MTDSTLSSAGLPDDWLHIESLDLDAQGVAHRADGKVCFVEGALPGELVSASKLRSKSKWEQGVVTAIHQQSSQRVQPGCPHFGLHHGACGGCKMQHFQSSAQVAVKQRVLEDNLWHLGKVRPEHLLRPIEGPAWGYRYRARLSVRYVRKKDTVLIGFHERKSHYVADMTECKVLPTHVSALLLPLRELIGQLDARESCPQIELACGDKVTALVLRHLEKLSELDLGRLRQFADAYNATQTQGNEAIEWWLQPKGPDTVHRLGQHDSHLAYSLPEFGVIMPFKPTDFTQVNPMINQVLVSRALRLLEVHRTERVIDWFCGLGNFTLPLATQAREVLGVEGSDALVARSRENFEKNQARVVVGRSFCATKFIAKNLFELNCEGLVALKTAQKWLVDPPREGAFALIKALADLHQQPRVQDGWQPPQRIVYVSCNPATLARDAGLLVHQAGYRCTRAGIVNMFPHTAHVESMAVFELGEPSG